MVIVASATMSVNDPSHLRFDYHTLHCPTLGPDGFVMRSIHPKQQQKQQQKEQQKQQQKEHKKHNW